MNKRLDEWIEEGKSYLLGLSGGSDSMALFYLLLELRKKRPFQLHIAHVDHAWRPESAQEALELKRLARENHCPFYLRRLKGLPESNREDAARQERLAFFQELFQEHSFEALLLAHQADDQVETILKRFLEGAGLSAMSGLREKAQYEGMPIWRPLLKVYKSQLQHYLEENNLQHFEDSSNLDPHYLRSRMRLELIPQLEKSFGKNFQENLIRWAERFQTLGDYVERRIEPLLQSHGGSYPFHLDLEPFLPMEKVEFDALIQRVCARARGWISHDSRDKLYELLHHKKTGKQIMSSNLLFTVQKKGILIERKREKIHSEK